MKVETILCGDARERVAELPPGSVQCCVTSPPYWGLRDYQNDDQIGAETDIEDYISNLVEVFERVRTALADNGTLWVNLGDSYTSGGRRRRATDQKNPARKMSYRAPTPTGLKPKDLIGVPWRVAFALQRSGWYLRSEIVWYKPNCQPESVKDRPTRSHEFVFMLSKSERYHYDRDSIREPAADGKTRNRRSVWSINTKPFKGAHFATFPPELARLCILAGSPAGGLVLDPFFGAGTVGVVCDEERRRFVGIEINREYIELAKARIKMGRSE